MYKPNQYKTNNILLDLIANKVDKGRNYFQNGMDKFKSLGGAEYRKQLRPSTSGVGLYDVVPLQIYSGNPIAGSSIIYMGGMQVR